MTTTAIDGLVKRLRNRAEACRLTANYMMADEFNGYADALSDTDRRVADEREACAKICDEWVTIATRWRSNIGDYNSHEATSACTQRDTSQAIASAIRSRSNDAAIGDSEHASVCGNLRRGSGGGHSSVAGVQDLPVSTAVQSCLPDGEAPNQEASDVTAQPQKTLAEMVADDWKRPVSEYDRAPLQGVTAQPQGLSLERAQRSANDVSERVDPSGFKPDWTLTDIEKVIVALSLALPKHVPGWPGCTDEQMEAIARDAIEDVHQPSPVVTVEVERLIARAFKRGFIWCEANEGDDRYLDKAANDHADATMSELPPPPSPPVGWQDREPDGYSTDDEGGLLEDLLDEHDHGAITELTPYWCGERQWAVVHYDEDGLADHRLFDSEDEAKKFRDSSSAAALSEGGE